MNELRVELKVRNNRLYKLIFGQYQSVSVFCRDIKKVAPTIVGDLLNLKMHPKLKNGEYRKAVKDICEFFTVLEEDIFPDKIYNIKAPNRAIEISFHEAQIEGQKLAYIEDYTEQIYIKDVNNEVNNALNIFPERTARIIRQRYGIDCEFLTLDEIAEKENISKSRVSNIEMKALRKLRSSQNRNIFRTYLEAINY